MALCEKILIAGFAGAGKSSMLKAVEATAPLEWSLFEDLDERILKNSRPKYKTVAELVEKEGWEKFRLWERQNLESWLKEDERGVLALGGGTLNALVLELLRPIRKVRIVYLDVPFEICWGRLKLDSVERPLVKQGEIELRKIYNERLKLFSQISWKMSNPNGADFTKLGKQFWDEIERS